MQRLVSLTALFLTVILATSEAYAASSLRKCRSVTGSRAAAMYSRTASEFIKCSRAVTKGKICQPGLRDAKIQVRLQKTRQGIRKRCDEALTAGWGYSSADAFMVEVAGRAAGEGRYVADSVFGREAVAMSKDDDRCANIIAKVVRVAAKKEIRTRIRCATVCSAKDLAKIETLWTKAHDKIVRVCSTASLTNLLATTDPTAYLASMRAGGQRVIDAVGNTSAFSPFASVASPTQNQILQPGAFPINVAITAQVAGVPHSSYVTSIEVGGTGPANQATYDAANDQFTFDMTVFQPGDGTDYPIALKAYSYLGTLTSVRTVKFNLSTLKPGVIIDTPTTGTITNAGSVTVSGRVLGNFSSPVPNLLVNGSPVAFDPSTGAWSSPVTLTSSQVQIVDAQVSSSLGSPSADTIVILHGTALPVGSGVYVQSGLYDRLNNTGFTAVRTMILDQLSTALSPAAIGTPDSSCGTGYAINSGGVNGCIDAFAFGTPNVPQIEATAATHILLSINLPTFHMVIGGIQQLGMTCTMTYNANNINIFADADLQPNAGDPLAANFTAVMNTPVVTSFTGSSASLSGGFLNLCSLGTLLTDVEGQVESGFRDSIAAELPATLNTTLAGIDVSTPIAGSTGVLFEGLFRDVPEDSQGIMFVVDENAVALTPSPDAPPITETLLPTGKPAPSLGPLIPNGDQLFWVPNGAPFDLAFCLTDGLLNRFMTSFMLQGLFNQSISDFPGIGPLTTDLLTLLFGDPAFGAACPGCNVTMALAPTAGPVARQPNPGEDADIVLTIPNYRIDIIADNAGTPLPEMSATIVFDLPLKLGAAGGVIAPVIGAPSISNLKVIDNPIGIQDASIANIEVQLKALFPQAAAAFGDLFTAIQLPPFQGLQLYGWGSGYNNSCAALYMGFSAPPPSPTPTDTPTPTNTPTPTETPLPTATPTGLPPLGSYTFALATGSEARIQGVVSLAFPLTGQMTLVGGVPDTLTGLASVQIPQSSVQFAPILLSLPGIDAVCVQAAGDGTGWIDCDGGEPNIDVSQSQDHNVGSAPCTLPATDDLTHVGVCNGAAVTTFSGTAGAGDMQVTMPVLIKMLATSQFGPDGQPCTADDVPGANPPSPVNVEMTTGNADATILHFLNGSSTRTATMTGSGLGCTNFSNGNLTGTTFVGAFTAIDAPTIGDIITKMTLKAQ